MWSTIFAGGTFAVIAATAIAALIQLRHLRASNQLNGLLTILRMWHDPKIQQWFDYVRDDLPEKMKDPQFRADLAGDRIDRRVHPELMVCDFWEQIGSYVKYGLLDEGSFLDVSCGTVNTFWEMLWPVTSIRRTRLGPSLYENFEYIAVRGRQWMAKHPFGSYPKALPRIADLDPQFGRLKTLEQSHE
jgi:hypothetical protein